MNALSARIARYQELIQHAMEVRQYPWRMTTATYPLLLAEFMLHRTQVRQVIPVYEAILSQYPRLVDFCAESEAIIQEKLSSLGLIWRQRALAAAMYDLYARYQAIPCDYDLLIQTPGIGPYIAGAVVCFARNVPMPLVDTNIVRVTGRFFGLRLEGEARRRKEIVDMIALTTPVDNPRHHYHALIDHAHHVCQLNLPACDECVLNALCCYYRS
jgi:A/G-specific adenine glycosylase